MPVEAVRGFAVPVSETGQNIGDFLVGSKEVVHQTGLHLINTRLEIDKLSKKYGRPVTLDDIQDDDWETLLDGHDSIWFMGIYAPSTASRNHALKWSHQYTYALPDLDPEKDVVGSPYSIPAYEPNPAIAQNWAEWDRMVEKMHAKGKKVYVDFVPNHMALDHPWAREHPEYFIQGTEEQHRQNADRYHEVEADDGKKYFLALGKDPYQYQWADVLQLNYGREDVQEEMEKILLELADHADGVRCDMAMLELPDTFLKVWGGAYLSEDEYRNMKVWGDFMTEEEKTYMREHPFWETTIPRVKEKAREKGKKFEFAAEAYWGIPELGKVFDYLYADDFYKHLKRIVKNHEKPGENLRNHVRYIMEAYKNGRPYKDLVYLENQDEERLIKELGREPSRAAATLTALMPETIFMLNQGQQEGRRIRPPLQIARLPEETPDPDTEDFYARLLTLKHSRLFQEGQWKMADITMQSDSMIALQVVMPDQGVGAVVCVNFGPHTSSCKIPEVGREKGAEVYRLSQGDYVQNKDMDRDGGMFVELIPWETQVVFYYDTQELPMAA